MGIYCDAVQYAAAGGSDDHPHLFIVEESGSNGLLSAPDRSVVAGWRRDAYFSAASVFQNDPVGTG